MNKLLQHFKRMQECASRFIEPYHDGKCKSDCSPREEKFIAYMLEALDGPEQREAELEATNVGITEAINQLCADVHSDNVKVGWWTDHKTGESILETRNVPEMLMLIVSEIAEGMEGYRKDLMDDKIVHRKMLEVELADAVIRIADLAGARGYDLGGAIAEKRAFNASRADHKLENRIKPGGKAF